MASNPQLQYWACNHSNSYQHAKVLYQCNDMFTMCDRCFQAYTSCPFGHGASKAPKPGPNPVVQSTRVAQSQVYPSSYRGNREQYYTSQSLVPQSPPDPLPFTTFYEARPAAEK